MSEELTNNLFNYATSELSQDAFLCWLLSYAQEKKYSGDDAKLKKCAQSLIKVFLLGQKGIFEKDLIEKDLIVKKIEKQWKYIDVLVTLESDKKIIIEDKTYTTDHDNQLQRYIRDVETQGKKVYGVYYKTGFCCETIEDDMYKGYYFFNLERIKDFFEKYDDIDNAIFNNYRDFIMEYHKERNNFIGLPVSKWTPTMIQGFYDNLVKKIKLKGELTDGHCGYGYVPNKSGGFYGLWLIPKGESKFKTNKEQTMKYIPYIQMQFEAKKDLNGKQQSTMKNGKQQSTMKICLKIEVKEGDDYINLRNEITKGERIFEVNPDNETIKFEKPQRWGSGRTMTLYELDLNNEGEYTEVKQVFEKVFKSFDEIYEKIGKRISEESDLKIS